MAYQLIFQPAGRRGLVDDSKTILECSRDLGVAIESPCGSGKVCGKCKIKVEEGFFEKFAIDSKMAHLSP